MYIFCSSAAPINPSATARSILFHLDFFLNFRSSRSHLPSLVSGLFQLFPNYYLRKKRTRTDSPIVVIKENPLITSRPYLVLRDNTSFCWKTPVFVYPNCHYNRWSPAVGVNVALMCNVSNSTQLLQYRT